MPRTVAGHLGLANPFHQVPPPSVPKVQHAAAWEIRFKWISLDILDVRSTEYTDQAKIAVLLWVVQALLKAPEHRLHPGGFFHAASPGDFRSKARSDEFHHTKRNHPQDLSGGSREGNEE